MSDISPAVGGLEGLRSLLFVPGDAPDKLAKALSTPADAVVCDLEDAVAPSRKRGARVNVRAALTPRGAAPAAMVRVNADEANLREDMAAVRGLALAALVVPKATPEVIRSLPAGPTPVVAIVETADGLRHACETAHHPRVAALMLGAADLTAELGLEPLPDGRELLFARSSLVVDSAAAGLRAPFDGVCLNVLDSGALRREAETARALGFGGKACLHPRQLAAVNDSFRPRPQAVARARRILHGYETALRDGVGASLVDGEMVDRPVAERARRLLAREEAFE
jgi:citrate lyase beta subunit